MEGISTWQILDLIFGIAIALQCDIPGECIGQLTGYTFANSYAECLSTCKGIVSKHFQRARGNISNKTYFKIPRDVPGSPLPQMITSVA